MTTRPVDRWFDAYGESHRNLVNEVLHFVCVPVISLCVLSFLSLVPWHLPGAASFDLAILFGGVVLGYYLVLSWRLALALVPVFVLLFQGADLLRHWQEAGGPAAWQSTLFLFVAAWIGQFIGHAIEGRKPSFLQDVQFLLIGPMWLMGQAFRRAGWRY